MTASTITPFNFNSHDVRVIIQDGNPWFVASDVCAVLGVKNHRDSLMHLDNDEKGVVSNDTLGGKQNVSVVNESGLYALVLRSRKPEAKKFTKWVTSEVLPSIRKTGQYQHGMPQPVGGVTRVLITHNAQDGSSHVEHLGAGAAVLHQAQDVITFIGGLPRAALDAASLSLDDWEMRSDRNFKGDRVLFIKSLDDWEMRSDRNSKVIVSCSSKSLDDWEMRSDRNPRAALDAASLQKLAILVNAQCFAVIEEERKDHTRAVDQIKAQLRGLNTTELLELAQESHSLTLRQAARPRLPRQLPLVPAH